MHKLAVSVGAFAAAASLGACSNLNRAHEEVLDHRAGIVVKQQDDGVQIRLSERVLFSSNRASLRADARRAIDRSVVLLKRSDKTIEVEGHTDDVGSHEYNQRLSEARARAVANALEQHNIPASRLRTVGYAYDHPVASNDTPGGRQRNRRVELVIIGESIDNILGR